MFPHLLQMEIISVPKGNVQNKENNRSLIRYILKPLHLVHIIILSQRLSASCIPLFRDCHGIMVYIYFFNDVTISTVRDFKFVDIRPSCLLSFCYINSYSNRYSSTSSTVAT